MLSAPADPGVGPPARQPVTAAVLLAGGTGQRAGVDKRYLVLGGRTLLQRGLLFLRASFPVVCVSLRLGQTVDTGDLGPVDVVYDQWPGGSPLAGIASALAHYRRPIFVMATDIAFPEETAVARLLSAYPGNDIALPLVEDRHEPLFAIYGPACLNPMTALLKRGQHRLLELLPHVRVARVDFADARPFHNINTMAAYAAAQGAIGSASPEPAFLAVVSRREADRSALIERLLPELARLGLRVATVDDTGTSSPAADAMNGYTGVDVVLVAGRQCTTRHRIEIFRPIADDEGPMCEPHEALALVADPPLEHPARFAPDDPAGLAVFIASRLHVLRDS